MRVATDSYVNSMINQANGLAAQLDNLENEVTTGLSVQAPSDNPGAMVTTLNDLASQSAEQQYGSNITTLQSQANSVYSVLQSLQTITSQAQSIVTEAGNGTAPQSTLNQYAGQVTALIQQAVQLINSQDPETGQYLFGGTDSGQQPFTATTDANGNVTGVTYQGNSSVSQADIAPGVAISVNVPGVNNSGTGAPGLITDARTGADLFNHLIALQNDLLSGNTSAISSTDTKNLQNDEDNMTYQVAYNGNIQTRLNTASSFATSQSTSLNKSISNASGADVVQAMVQLNQTQSAYEAALESTSRIMQVSLVDFLA
ncbi:MAG TPA: flagellin [Verrucomicrobiae bacterium]|jgi:flagellar hook-associated protein 3 FlgL